MSSSCDLRNYRFNMKTTLVPFLFPDLLKSHCLNVSQLTPQTPLTPMNCIKWGVLPFTENSCVKTGRDVIAHWIISRSRGVEG